MTLPPLSDGECGFSEIAGGNPSFEAVNFESIQCLIPNSVSPNGPSMTNLPVATRELTDSHWTLPRPRCCRSGDGQIRLYGLVAKRRRLCIRAVCLCSGVPCD